MKKITLFTREDCHLCHTAEWVLRQLGQQLPFELEVIDLDREAQPEKREKYTWEVPVLELDGRKIMKYRVDPQRLIRLLGTEE